MIKQLTITGGIPPFAVRGVTQSLEPINQAAQMRRNMNGTLIDLSDGMGFKKFASSINCEDMTSPAIEGVMPGVIVTVGCIVELCVAGALPPVPADWNGNSRPIVAGSLRERDGFIFYRPSLTMRVMGYSVERDEWGGVTSWSMDLEEV